MTISLGMITFDTTDPTRLARWWAEQTGGVVAHDGDGFCVVAVAENAPLLSFQHVEDPTPGKNRIHLDVTADDLGSEVERLTAAGATTIAAREMPGFSWVTLADPDGNQFCVSGKQEAASIFS